jgi:hypothetical protein
MPTPLSESHSIRSIDGIPSFYIGHKLKLPGRSHSIKEDKNDDHRLSRHSSGRFSDKFSSGEPDPGVISEDDDEFRVTFRVTGHCHSCNYFLIKPIPNYFTV